MLTLTFKRKHLIVLLICTVLLCVLLVCAGYLLHASRVAPPSPAGPPPASAASNSVSPAKIDGQIKPAIAPAETSSVPPASTPAAVMPEGAGANPATASPGPASASTPEASSAIHQRHPLTVEAPAAAELPAPGARRYSLQLGTYEEKTAAETKIKALKDSSVKAELFAGQDANGQGRFAVRCGSYPDLISATKAADALATQTGEFVVVRPAGRL